MNQKEHQKKSTKFMIYIVLVLILYFFMSKSLTKNGQFIQYHPILSSSIKESKNNKTYIQILDTCNYTIIGNKKFKSFINDSLDIWTEKIIYYKQYGAFPILRKKYIEKNDIGININFKKNIVWNDSKRLNDIEIKIDYFKHNLIYMVRIVIQKNRKYVIEFINSSNNKALGKIEITN